MNKKFFIREFNFIPNGKEVRICELCHEANPCMFYWVGYHYNTVEDVPLVLCNDCRNGDQRKIEALYTLDKL